MSMLSKKPAGTSSRVCVRGGLKLLVGGSDDGG
jgi:hypothetical protein